MLIFLLTEWRVLLACSTSHSRYSCHLHAATTMQYDTQEHCSRKLFQSNLSTRLAIGHLFMTLAQMLFTKSCNIQCHGYHQLWLTVCDGDDCGI
uniref:Uncharacterized protein n=1 Tax=Rhipicephalus appendiculatus TaxID=34631 RepID=A0A131YD42_RHIAP